MRDITTSRDEVAVAFAADENVALGLYVAIFSLLTHLSDTVDCTVFVADGGLRFSTKEKLSKLVDEFTNARIATIQLSTQRLEHLKDPTYVGRGSYLRFLIPERVQDQYDQVIYLDVDVLVLQDIGKLSSVDMEGTTVMACQDYVFPTITEARNVTKVSEVAGLPLETPYFNAGVLKIDTERWIKRRITEKSIDLLEENPTQLVLDDQDALNATLYNDWSILHPVWNVQLNWVSDEKNEIKLKNYSKKNFEEVLRNPGILHYNHSVKPWNMGFAGQYRKVYLQHLKHSPYMNFVEYELWLAMSLIRHVGVQAYAMGARYTRPYRHQIRRLLRGKSV
jgi:lipopolysaccharide biosynthesis glycosyltransferase